MAGNTELQHYRTAFEMGLKIDAAQMDSRVASKVDARFNYGEKGDSFSVDNLGNSDPSPMDDRYGDLPEGDIEHRRRVGHFEPWQDGRRLGSKFDEVRQVTDPTNDKMIAMKAGLARRQDVCVMAAILGTAYSGRTGTTSSVLPAAQKIAVDDHTYDANSGDYPLTVSKVMLAKEKLDAAEIAGKRHIIVPARQISHMLTDTQVTSADFNTVKALVHGEIDEWLGFTWTRYESVLTDGSSDQLIAAFVEPAVCFRQRTLRAPDIWERKDKVPHWYGYYSVDQAAVRREDAGVIQIACDPN